MLCHITELAACLYLDQSVQYQRGHTLLLIVLFKQDLHHRVPGKRRQ